MKQTIELLQFYMNRISKIFIILKKILMGQTRCEMLLM